MKNKIYKLLSIVLAIMVVFSCCSVAFTAFAEEEIAATYYISATGSDTDGTGKADAPFLSLGQAISQATTDGHNVAGKTVAVHVSNPDGNTSVNTVGSLSATNCDLIIFADDAQTTLFNSDGGFGFSGSGTLTFKNIYLYARSYANISFGNKDVTFDSGSKLVPGIWGGYTSIGLFNTNSSTTKPLHFTMNGVSETIYLCDPQSTRSFRNPLYITYDGGAAQAFGFGCPRSDYDSVTTYTKAVNFNLKSASSITFDTAVGSTTFTDDGLIQVINSTGKELTGLDTIVNAKLTTLESSNATFEADDTPVTKWILTNQNTEYKNAIDFTDTVGLYDVAEGYTVIATKVGDDNVVVASAAPEGSQDVVLDLRAYGAGEYNLTVERHTNYVANYYVSAAGSDENDGKKDTTPVLTVGKAIELAIADDYSVTDTVNINVMGTDTVSYGSYANNGAHPKYNFTAVIKSNTSSTQANVNMNDIPLGGTTKFEWVATTNCSKLGFQNVTFDENSRFSDDYPSAGCYNSDTYSAARTTNGFTQVLRGNVWSFNTTNQYGSATHNGPINIYVENFTNFAAGSFSLTNSSTSTYNAGVNFSIKNINKDFTIAGASGKYAFGENGGIQVINSSGKTCNSGNNLAAIEGTTNKYYITNSTDNKDLLSFTETLGKYQVNGINEDIYYVRATSVADATVYFDSEDGILNVVPGEYTLSIERKSNLSVNYYVSAEGSDDNDGKTTDKPFLTVNAAVNAAIAAGYSTGDTVTIKTIGSATIASGLGTRERLAAYNFKLVITANDTSVPATISGYFEIGGVSEFSYVTFGGEVTLDGFSATFGTGAKVSSTGSYNVGIGHNSNMVGKRGTGPINVKFSRLDRNQFYFCGTYYNTASYNDSITVEIDDYQPYYGDIVYGGFRFSDGNCTGKYYAPVNVKVNGGDKPLYFRSSTAKTTYGENFAFQLINASGKALVKTGDTLTRDDSAKGTATSALDTMPEGSVYVLTNNTSNKNLVTFTPTVGTYAVNGIDEDVYTVRATSVSDSSVYFDSKNGFLTVESGEYNISVEKVTGKTITYYVGSTGSDETGDGTEGKPFATVTKALSLATAKGYGKGNTVVVMLLSNVAWGSIADAPREYAVVLDSALETPPTVDYGGVSFIVGGDIHFKNVKNNYGGDGWRLLGLRGGNATFSSTAATPNYVLAFGWDAAYDADTPVAGQNVVFNNNVGASYIRIAHSSNGILHYTDDVNITINNKDASPRFGFEPEYNNTTKLDSGKVMNFIVNKAKSLTLADVSSANTGNASLDGAVQVILNDPTTTFSDESKAHLTDTLTVKEGVFIIRNKTGIANLISPVKNTAGTYKVDLDTTRYNLLINGEAAVVENGYVTVPAAGDYEFTVTVNAMNKEYFVENGATEGDGSESKPFATVAEAIAAAKALDLTVGDNVTVKVKGETTVEWGTVEAYDFMLKVISASAETKSTVYIANALTGDVEFDNINITVPNPPANNPYSMPFAGHNVKFGTNATLNAMIVTSAQGKTNEDEIVIEFNNAFNYASQSGYENITVGNSVQNNVTYKKDVSYIINNAAAAPEFTFMPYYGGTIKFNGNFNIVIKDAASVSFSGTSKEAGSNGIQAGSVTVDGAVQFILPGSTTISDTSLANFKTLGNYYLLRNNSEEIVDVTATAGIYSVTGNDTVYAYKDGVKVAESVNGLLNLTETGFGEYILVKTREAKVFEFTNADGATIADMISKAIGNGAVEGDTLKITLTGTDAVAYGTPVEHLFDVEIISTENTPVSFVSQDILKGDTKFDGVKVSYPGGENTLWLGGHNVTFTASTVISGGYYIGFGSHNTYMTYDEQTVVIDCAGPMYLNLAGDWANITRTGDLNVKLGHASYAPQFFFGMHGVNTYLGAINIDLGATTNAGFKDVGDDTLVITGGVNVIGNSPVANTTYIDGIDGDIYTVADPDDLLDFGDAAGKFTVAGEDVVRAIGANGYVDSADGVLDLTAVGEGNYTLGLPHVYDGEETKYAEYIDYRTALNGNDALNNFAAKVNAGEDVNVVYYGGSVTAGSGASHGDTTSWRGITSQWLSLNAPNSKVTNINSAIGGTGSHFGFYRLDEAVLAYDPDLLFIEFSINDFYDNQDRWDIGEDRAAMQLESIIRKVRTEAPDCDIVVVLTTEKSLIGSLQTSDTLHAQARGHYRIAQKYGIPTLRVGHALADHLAATGEDWSDYVTDIVHPNDKGYQVYAGVVKEFLANSLLGDTNEGALVKPHTVPENTVSDKIWAGDPVFIPADAELSAESASLGGSEFQVHSGPANNRTYPYHETFYSMSDTEAVLKFKFTGTELSVHDDQYSHAYNGFNVKIDGGEEYYVEIRNYKPTILASGLENTEHTAEIRIADENQGGGQWVYGFFVRDEADDITKQSETGTYYVSAEGDDTANNGLTAETPVKTVKKAIQNAIDYGYGSRDKVYIKVIGTAAVDFGADDNAMPSHGFKLNISSYTSGATVGVNDGTIHLGGDTDFENITVHIATYSTYASLNFNDHSVNFLADATIKNINVSTLTLGSYATDNTVTTPVNLVVDSNIANSADKLAVKIGNEWNYKTYDAPINITFNRAAIKSNVAFGGGNGITTFNAPINFNIKSATSVALNNTGEHVPEFGENSAIQVINSAGATITMKDALATALGNKYWLINNTSGKNDFLSFTDVAGKYSVNLDLALYTVTATSKDGTKSATAASGVLDLTALGAGEYDITVTKIPAYKTYYVQTGATEGDGSLTKPFATVMDAVAAAKEAGYTMSDEVTVMLLGTEAVAWGTAVNYDFLLVVDSSNKLTVNNDNNMTGDVKFDNVVVNKSIVAYGYNLEITTNTTYNTTINGHVQQKTVNETQTIKISNNYTSGLHIGSGNYGGIIWNEDANYIFDNAQMYPTINFTPYYGATNTFKKNFNLIIKDARGIAISTPDGTTGQGTYNTVVNGAVNVLIPSDCTISEDSYTNLYALTDNVYYVVNALGKAGDIDYVYGSAGKFNVNVDTTKYNVYLTDEEGNTTEIQSGELQLDAAGKYTVSATRKTATVVYYAQAGGEGDGSSAESPLGSVNAVIEKAIADDCDYDSISVKLMVLGTEALDWGVAEAGKLTAHKFELMIDSETEGAKVGNNKTIHMGGDIDVRNVEILISGTASSYPAFALAGHDAYIHSSVQFDGSYWTFVNALNSGGMDLKEDQHVTIEAYVPSIAVSNAMSATTYVNADLYITFNRADVSPSFAFGSAWGASTYNNNIFIDLVAASGASFTAGGYEGGANFGDDLKVQIINRTNANITAETGALANIGASKVWVINSKLGDLGTIEGTSTIGLFDVDCDEELYTIKAIGDSVYAAQNGVLNIPAAGTYTVKTVRNTVDTTIYVSENGSAEGSGTEDEPFLTVEQAIKAALKTGYGADDTITIKLMGDAVETGNIPAYEFDLIVTSAAAKSKLVVTSNSIANEEGGEVRFSNVTISKAESYKYVVLNDSNAVFESNVSFEFGYDTFLAIGTDNDGGADKTVGGRDIVFNGTTPIISLSNNRWANRTYSDDVNLVINNANADARIRFNATYGGASNGTTVFDKMLNINIKNAENVSFDYGTGVTVNGGLQIINSSAVALDLNNAGIADVTGDKWIINNKLGAENISYTETAGKFTVADYDSKNYTINVVGANGASYTFTGNTFSLEPGAYTVELVRIPKEASYTLTADGEYPSIEAAVLAANAAGYTTGDTVTFYISGETAVPWGQTLTTPDRLTAYKYNLIITTAEGEDKRTVGEGNKRATLSGPTEFKNIHINVNGTQSSYPTFGMGGNDVIFNSDVTFEGGYWGFVTGQFNASLNVRESMELYIANSLSGIKIGNSYTGNTYHEDVTITYNKSSNTPTFTFGTGSSEYTNFKKNVNFNLMAAKGVNFAKTGHTFAVGSAIQIINSCDVAVDSTTGVLDELVDTDGNSVPKYIINNKTGNVNAISFTETAGTYNIDLGDLKYEGYYAVVTNNTTGDVLNVKGDSVQLAAGEYTVTVARDGTQKEYTITSGTLADAIQTAIDEGYGYGDDVTFKLGSLEEIEVGNLPRYNFNLVIESDAQTRLNLGTNRAIANNEGALTHFKNVEIYKEAKYSTITLNGSSAIFDKDCIITTGGYCTLSYGYVTDETKDAQTVEGEQKVVIDCPAPAYISLSSWLYANKTYEDDVTLIINNDKTDTKILFNAYSDGSVNGVTNYLGNVNINIKKAASVRFDYFDGTAPGNSTYVQLLVNGRTSIVEEEVIELNEALGYGEIYCVVDKSFQRGILELTDEFGVYSLNTDYDVTATKVKEYNFDYAFEDCNGSVYEASDNKITVDEPGVWEVRTDEYFEDFNVESIDELRGDWKFSSDSSSVSAETELVDGTLKLVSQHNLKEIPALNKNLNINSKEQFISVDMKGANFNWYNGLEIMARLGGNAPMEGYEFHISNGFIRLQKLDGVTKSGGYYTPTNDGFEVDGLWGRLPGSINKGDANNSFTLNYDHTYRIGFSVVSDTDENGNEIAYVRGIVLNLTTNEVMFDDTFRDNAPYKGTEFAIFSPAGGSDVYIDNLYFSSKKFREGDEGILDGDINGDDVYDIRDLVFTNEKAKMADSTLLYKADKNTNGAIDEGDYAIIRKEILADKQIGNEFALTATTDVAADAMRKEILNATSEIVTEGGVTYYVASNGVKEKITGDIWYVSSKATGTGNAGTKADPWTFAELQAQVKPNGRNNTYTSRKVGAGDAVLFERGSVFRTNDLMRDESTSGQTADCYSYLVMSESTLYGAYGTGAKPKFIDSYKNYNDSAWSEVAGQENVWVIDAPEIIIDREGNERVANGRYNGENSATNIIFNNGEKIGQRKAFPNSARNGGKVYTIFKDGQFTYDEVNGKLYLYSKVNPTSYESIEVSRGIYGIQVNSHESHVVVDNLAFHGFAKGAIGSNYGSNDMLVTNCDIGYSGGTTMGSVRGGNAVGLWGGGSDIRVNYNWIYQTWDSAISPQGNAGFDYTGFQVIGNLLEYNNADIEIFDRGVNKNTGAGAIWNDCIISDNLMRFTTLGWGSREADKIRGIQGVIRGGVSGASSVDIDWTNNTIDTPGMEIIRFDNTTSFTQEGEGDEAVVTTTGIFRFGTNGSTIDNNTYYYNPYVRNTALAVREYMTAVPADYMAQHGTTENTSRTAKTAASFFNAMTAFDTGANSRFFWGGTQVKSGN